VNWSRLRRIWLFERRSFTDSALLDQWRLTWPTWRRLVRPVGASAVWLVPVVEAFSDNEGSVARPVLLVLASIVLACVAFGLIDYLRVGGEVGLQQSINGRPADAPSWSRWIPAAGVSALQNTGLTYLAVIIIVLMSFIAQAVSIVVYGLVALFLIAVIVSPRWTARVLGTISTIARSERE
jgi:hypothetical protein